MLINQLSMARLAPGVDSSIVSDNVGNVLWVYGCQVGDQVGGFRCIVFATCS